MNDILVVQTAYLGDVVLTTPLLRSLLRRRSGARIEVVTTPGGAELLEGTAGIHRIHVYDKRGSRFGLRGLRGLAGNLRARRYDAGIAAQRSFRTGLLLRLAGISRVVGFAGAPGSWAYNDKVSWADGDPVTRRYLALGRPFGGDHPDDDDMPRLGIPEGTLDEVGALLHRNGIAPGEPFACLAPGSARATKRWPADRFGLVARTLAADGLRSVFVGAPDEIEMCAEAARFGGRGAVDLTGRLGLRQLPALMRRAVAVVGNDSAPTHVAAAVGTPVVVVFGPTVPAMGYLPQGDAVQVVEHPSLTCRPCSRHGGARCPQGHFRCMQDIAPDAVLEAIGRQTVRPG